MKAIRTLIKLARAQVDAAQRALAEAERQHVRALARIAALDVGVVQEQAVAMGSPAGLSTYGGYARARADDRRALVAEEAAYAEHERALRAQLTAAHVELKKLERLAELDAARRAEDERRRAQDELDEQATLRAARKELR